MATLAPLAAAVVALRDAGGRVAYDDDGNVTLDIPKGFFYRTEIEAADPAVLDALARCWDWPKRGKPKLRFGICDKCGEPAFIYRRVSAKCRITPKCKGKHVGIEVTKPSD